MTDRARRRLGRAGIVAALALAAAGLSSVAPGVPRNLFADEAFGHSLR